MNNRYKVTIAIPTYNRSAYLKQAIESALSQSYENIEILVSDNCSPDDTEAMVREFTDSRLRYFRQSENNGLVNNWNFCLNNATGEYFLLLSDDDLLDKYALEWFVSQLEDPAVSLAYSRCQYIDQNSNPLKLSLNAPERESGHNFIDKMLHWKRETLPSATLYRTSDARMAGCYPDIGTATDMALHLLLATKGEIVFNQKPLVRYRIHSENLFTSADVILSQEKLIDWVSHPGCPLNSYRKLVCKFSVQFIYKWGRTQALNGNKNNLLLTKKILYKLAPCWVKLFSLSLYYLPPVRMLASIRRYLRNELLLFRRAQTSIKH